MKEEEEEEPSRGGCVGRTRRVLGAGARKSRQVPTASSSLSKKKDEFIYLFSATRSIRDVRRVRQQGLCVTRKTDTGSVSHHGVSACEWNNLWLSVKLYSKLTFLTLT